jgi:quercetin dioxygenase-like cupin family protein
VIGKPTAISAGDVVSLPSGVLRSSAGAAEDTTIVAFSVGHTDLKAKAAVVRAKDVPEQAIAAGPKAGIGAAKVAVRRYTFPGNTVRVASVAGPGKTNPATPGTDVLLYLTAGKATVTIGSETHEVSAGDTVREPAGVEMFWDVKDSLSFVATDAPAAAPKSK